MAITFANLGASAAPDINSSTDATSYASASWSPPTTGLIVLYVLGARTAGPTTPTVSGNSITWTQIGSTLSMAGGERALSLFVAVATGATTGATTIDFGGVTQLGCVASFFHADGVDVSGGAAAAVVQSVTATASTGTSGSVVLAAAGNAANRPIAGWFHSTSEATTHRTDWTEADDLLGTSPSRSLETQYRADAFETTASASWATSSFRGVIAAELKAIATPTAPSDLTATAASASQIYLNWVDNSDDELNFELERSPDGTTGWTLIDSPAANVTVYSDEGLTQNTEYFYRVRASNASGDSAYTSVASALTFLTQREPFTPRLYIHQPATVLAAKVNWPSAVYPLDYFDVDNITSGSMADVKAGMTLLIGTVAGADNLGRQRIRLDSSGNRLFVGRSSRGTHDGELTVTDDAFVTVLDDRRVWAKIPYITTDGTIYKDSDLAVGTNTTTPPPVANCGPGFAATIDATTSEINVLFNGQSSFATSDAATITGYLWDIEDGTLLTGALTDDFIQVSFPAGFRYVSLTVTDSNGKTHTAYCPVYARDPEADTSFDEFSIESHRVTDAGQTMSVGIYADMPRGTYPDGTLVMIWSREPNSTAGRDHMLFQGWIDTEPASMNAGRTGLLRDTTLDLVDVAGRLAQLPGFPQSVADDATRDSGEIAAITWSYMTTPNLDKYLHYLLQWHSTALELADFIWTGTGDEYEFVLLGSDGESLWEQVDRRARAFVPDRVLTCDERGRIVVYPHPMLQDEADRTATVQAAIDENEWSDIRYTYQRSPRVHWLRASAVLAGSTEPIGTVFSIAPGDTPGQGVGELTQGEQLAISQAALNAATGHRYARANAPQGALVITLVQDDGAGTFVPWSEIEPAKMEWVTLTVSAETAAQRGLTFTAASGLPKEKNIRYNTTRTGTTRTVELVWERETVGEVGKTVVKPVVPGEGDQPIVTIPPDFGLVEGVGMVAAVDLDGFIYRTSDFETVSGSGGPTWDRVDTGITETLYSFVVDPFSPGYIVGTGSIDGWIATETDIYRVEDMFAVTPSVNSVHTFATTATAASFHWRSIQASFGRFFAEGVNPWLLCISYYGDTVGHEGTWATYSVDGGTTWATEVEISEFYDSVAATRFNPIGVYASPKTPGLAYTAAHVSGTAGTAPLWGVINTSTSTLVDTHIGPTLSYELTAHAEGAVALDESGTYHIVVAPPAAAVRMVIEASYENTATVTSDAFTSFSTTYGLAEPVGAPAATEDLTYTSPPGAGGTTSQTYTVEWTRDGGATDWEGSREEFELSPPSTNGNSYRRFVLAVNANKTGGSSACTNYLFHSATVTEIELEDATIYDPSAGAVAGFVSTDWGATWAETALIVPGDAQAGSIHLPWPLNDAEGLIYYGALDRTTNREFRLHRSDGGIITDISPSDGSVSYGVNRFGFAARTFDSNRQYILVSGIGNDTSASAGDDLHAVFVSDDYGATWTEVIAPVADTSAPADRPAFEAAFGGDSANIVFIWGPAADIRYSSNMGVAVDSRAGNLGALGATGFIGIAGGPTA